MTVNRGFWQGIVEDTVIGKSMFMAKKGASAKLPERTSSGVAREEKLPTRTGFDNDYDRVQRDEQCDDWNGFPKT